MLVKRKIIYKYTANEIFKDDYYVEQEKQVVNAETGETERTFPRRWAFVLYFG